MEFINLKAAYAKNANLYNEAFARLAAEASFIGGAEVAALEHELAMFVDASGNTGCLTCSDGTNALILALKAIGVQPGDEIITSAFTFIATAEAIALCGAKPVFADINEEFCLDYECVKAAISDKTKAILSVSLFGNMGGLERLSQLAKERGILLIEDAAQSFGAMSEYARTSCSVADISTTSFFPSKPLGCFGDGGAIFSKNKDYLNRARLLANHGSSRRYEHEIIGTNSRLDSLQAAILRIRLKDFASELAERQRLAAKYLANLPVGMVLPRVCARSAWAQFSVLVDDRDKFCQALKAKNIPTAVHYPKPLHLQDAFGYLNIAPGSLPKSEFAAAHICSLPFSAWLSDDECDEVIAACKDAIKEQGSISWRKKAAVLGCGAMGKNHIRELLKSGYEVSAYDEAPVNLDEFGRAGLKFGELNEEYELAIIATPTSTHEAASKQIRAKKLIVEKPFASSVQEALKIDDTALCGFCERFNSGFLNLLSYLGDQKIYKAQFWRKSAQPERIKDMDVAMDLACHDLDLAAVLGFDLDKLQLINREQDYFCARSDELEITASWREKEPSRWLILHAESGVYGLDFMNAGLYFAKVYDGQNWQKQLSGARFSNLASMYESGKIASKEDAIRVLKTLERLTNKKG